MKKVTIRKVPARKASTQTIETIICDFCISKAKTQCCSCRRDICETHKNYDPECWDDYPAIWCPICLKLMLGVSEQKIKIQEDADREIAKINIDVKKRSLAIETGKA